MGGGDLNTKKSWHPHTMKNQERVWKAEQQNAAEKRKVVELENEIRNERSREELKDIARKSGIINTADPSKKLEWMYKETKVNREEYLLGRSIDKTYEQQVQNQDQDAAAAAAAKNHVEHECIPFSIRQYKGFENHEQVDTTRKLMEDPLMLIQQKELDSRRKLLENPVKLKELHKLLKEEKASASKAEKKSKKSKKSKKHKDKKSKDSGSDSDSSASEKDLDKLLTKKYKNLQSNMDDDESRDMNLDKLLRMKYNTLSKELDKMNNRKKKKRDDSSDDGGRELGDRNREPDRRRERQNSRDQYNKHNRERSLDRNKGRGRDNQDRRGSRDRRIRSRSRSASRIRRNGSSTKSRQQSRSPIRSRQRSRSRNRKKESPQRSRQRSDSRKRRNEGPKRTRQQSRSPIRSRQRSRDRSESRNRQNASPKRSRKQSRSIERKSRGTRQRSRSRSRSVDRKRKARHQSSSPEARDLKRVPKTSATKSPSRMKSSSRSSSSSRSYSTSNSSDSSLPVRRPLNSDDEEMPQQKKFGLVTADGQQLEIKDKNSYKKPEIPSKSTAKACTDSSASKRIAPAKLSEDEIAKRYREMMDNVEWREKDRQKTVKKYSEDEMKQKERDHGKAYDHEFINKELHKATSKETVEHRIKSNLNNIQRSGRSMNDNFARR